MKCIVDGTYSLIIIQTKECINMIKHTILFVVVRISDCGESSNYLVADEQKRNKKELDGRRNKTMKKSTRLQYRPLQRPQLTRIEDKGDQPSGGETNWTNTGAKRSGRGQHKIG